MSIRLAAALLVLLCPFAVTQATTITFTASDLPDSTPGEDLWRYDYTVTGRSFLQSEFFDIYFEPNLYGTLTAGPAPDPGWDVLILQQPDPANLPPFDRGIFDAFALTDNPPLLDAFSVSFVFLGAGSPGPQLFEIFDADSELVESGITSVPGEEVIPEPSTAALLLIGLATCAIHTYRRTSIRR